MRVNFLYEDGKTGSFTKAFSTNGLPWGLLIKKDSTMKEIMQFVLPSHVYIAWLTDEITLMADSVMLLRDTKINEIYPYEKDWGTRILSVVY